MTGTQRITNELEAEERPVLIRLGDKLMLSWGDNSFSDTDTFQMVLPDSAAGFVLPPQNFVESVSTIDSFRPVSAAVSKDLALTFYTDLTGSVVQSGLTKLRLNVSGDNADDTYVATKAQEFIALSLGIDTVSYAASTAAVRAEIGGTTLGGFAQNDSYSNVENLIGSAFGDALRGNSGANALTGGAGNDTLLGQGGADTIAGGLGRDVMRGGTEADVFLFKTVAEIGKGTATDRIADFVSSVDDIDLSALDANTKLAGNQSFGFGNGTATKNAVWFKTVGTDVTVSGDVNGDRIADFQIVLKGAISLVVTDFLL